MQFSPQQDLLSENELNIQYSGFWPRFFALMIDGLVLTILAPLSYYNTFVWQSVPLLILLFIIQIVYKPFFEYKYNATPGKMALGIKVVNHEFEKPGFIEVLSRNIFQIMFTIIFMLINVYKMNHPVFSRSLYNDNDFLSEYSSPTWSLDNIILAVEFFIFAIFLIDTVFLITNDERRSLHDRIGKTYVIKSR